MEQRALGRSGLPRLRPRPRLHGHVRVLRPARRRRVDRHDPRAPSTSASPSSTPPTSTGRTPTRSSSAARSAGGATEVVLATKFGIVRDPDDPTKRGISGRPEYVRQACDGSLRRLGVDAHRPLLPAPRRSRRRRSRTPSARWPSSCAQGKVRFLGLSEAGAETLRRAQRASIRSPRCRASTRSGAATRRTACSPTCRELGIGFVAYSPLGRGFLTGADPPLRGPRRRTTTAASRRASRARTSQKNLDLVARVEAIAREKGCTPAQLALAWVLAQGDDVVPIPGTKRRDVPRGERRRARRRAARRARPRAHRRGRAARRGRRRALPGRVHEPRQRLTGAAAVAPIHAPTRSRSTGSGTLPPPSTASWKARSSKAGPRVRSACSRSLRISR